MKIELIDCTNTILREIAMPEMKRKDVAMTYAFCLKSSEQIDWVRINKAIVERWSTSGLIWIKTKAHSGACFS